MAFPSVPNFNWQAHLAIAPHFYVCHITKTLDREHGYNEINSFQLASLTEHRNYQLLLENGPTPILNHNTVTQS